MSRQKQAKRRANLLEFLAKAQYDRQQLDRQRSAQLAELAEKRSALAAAKSQLENLLHEALSQDSAIDLESLKESPAKPAFEGKRPRRLSYLPEPLSRADALKPWKRAEYQAAVHKAEEAFKRDLAAFNQGERERIAAVARENQATEDHNQDIEQFIRDFAEGKRAAIIRYFRLVLNKSAWPPGFPNNADLDYDAETGQLRVNFSLPAIDVIPAIEGYAFDRDTGEIAAIAMPPEQRGQLYSATLARACLRALHEIFSADRTQTLASIAFRGCVEGMNPSTGNPGRFCLLALNVTRQQFERLALEHVEPLACLRGLNASLSAEPEALRPVALSGHEDSPTAVADDKAELADHTGALETADQAQAERISELENEIENKNGQIAELEGWLALQREENAALREALSEKQIEISTGESQLESQKRQLADIQPALREEQARAADLTSEVQAQRLYIAVLEGKLKSQSQDRIEAEMPSAEALDDTQPIAALDEQEIELAEEEIFTPIGDEEPRDESADTPIPPRGILPDRESLHVMAVFHEADGEYVDYIGERLPKAVINRLALENKLERHKFHSYKLRATEVGLEWYRELLRELEATEADDAEQPASAESKPDKTTTLGDLLRGDVDDAGVTQQASQLHDADTQKLVDRLKRLGEDEAKLLKLLVSGKWTCSVESVQSAYAGRPFVRPMVDNINEAIFDVFSDNLIEEDDARLVVGGEFRESLKAAIEMTDNPYLRE